MSDNERMDAQDRRQDRQDTRADTSEAKAVDETARQDAEHIRQDEATAIDHDRLEKMARWFRRRWWIPVAIAALAAVAAYGSANSNSNTTKLNEQGAELLVLQAEVQQLVTFDQNQTKASAASSAILNQFFVGFIAEQNYLCRIASSRAVISGLEPPPAGICQVTLGRAPPAPSAAP